jgi:CRISPR-associated endonuclease/helicase Cas3
MCGAHRAKVLDEIHARLGRGSDCQVVSTQLIEAGVDIDFPVVYRALAGVDSIAQAAGRCNREGTLKRGEVVVFTPNDVRLQGYLRSTADSAAELIPDATDLLDPEVVRRYFELHYWKQEGERCWDKHNIMNCFPTPLQKLHFQYRTASDAFRFIATIGKPVFVPYGKTGAHLIEQLRAIRPETSGGLRALLRRFQRYTVNVYDRVYDAMLGTDIELLGTGYAVLINPDCYDDRLGFRVERLGYHEPEALIC